VKSLALIVTCEHGGPVIPPPYRGLFKDRRNLLDSHSGCDLGALAMARRMAKRFDAPLFAATRSRLLVDLNRSIGHPNLFSGITRCLPATEKENILKKYYTPHRDSIQQAVSKAIRSGRAVLHIAVHSFTPVLRGRSRSMDVGLLYDPVRLGERRFCRTWKKEMQARSPECSVRCNAPYKGVSDGLATYFRTLFTRDYMGIELELNQFHYQQGPAAWRRLGGVVLDGLEAALMKSAIS
jgi:predicted N-formylglutamate amidohydrolase